MTMIEGRIMSYNIKDYIAEDGLMSLTSRSEDGMRPGHGTSRLETVNNDNGILFRTLYMYLTNYEDNYTYAVVMTESKVEGLYHRNRGRINYINSDDNLLAMASGCLRVGDASMFKKINKHFFIWNDENPGHLQLKVKFRPSGFFQPHVWAMFQMASGLLWEPLSAFWLFTNLLVNSWFYKKKQFDRKMILWLRCRSIEENSKKIFFLYRPFIKWAVKQFKKRTIKEGGAQIYFSYYFNKQHPNYIESRGLMWD